MDFMKVFDQTVREIKREVNLKVLKIPEIEQKVLDATDDEPWGPHGTVLAEIAQATKKFSECQMVMNVLWTRLTETGKNWRFVYKSLAVIEYLVANGSERAVDDIVEHTFQISALSSFEYVEPSGKDLGINIRKKVETIVALLNNKDKIQDVRNKAATTRDKYFGLSSTGITYKSGSASLGTTSSRGGDRYGGFGITRDGESLSDSYKDRDQSEDKFVKSSNKPRRGDNGDSQGNTVKKGSTRHSRGQTTSSASESLSKNSQSSNAPSNDYEDSFEDFDPRGTSSSSKSAAGSSHEADLFGQSLISDLLDAPVSVPAENVVVNSSSSDVDLFADATFVSASSNAAGGNIDLFAAQPTSSSAVSSTMDFFSAPVPVPAEAVDPFAAQIDKFSEPVQVATNVVDPFAAMPLNSFDSSDLFGSFTSHVDSSPKEPYYGATDINSNGKSQTESKTPPKKDTFQVKSGIWADSLSRGLIDLNISAPKKVNLADVGVVGGLTEADDSAKAPPTSYYMGRAMGTGSGLGISDFSPTAATPAGVDDLFSSLANQQQYQFGGFQK